MGVLSSLLAISEPLLVGLLGAFLTLAGSALRSGQSTAPQRTGNYFCVLGLILMTVGFLCVTSNTSLLAYAQRI